MQRRSRAKHVGGMPYSKLVTLPSRRDSGTPVRGDATTGDSKQGFWLQRLRLQPANGAHDYPFANRLYLAVAHQGSASSFAFSRSNSACVRAPLSSSFFNEATLSYLLWLTTSAPGLVGGFGTHSNTSSTRGKFPSM